MNTDKQTWQERLRKEMYDIFPSTVIANFSDWIEQNKELIAQKEWISVEEYERVVNKIGELEMKLEEADEYIRELQLNTEF